MVKRHITEIVPEMQYNHICTELCCDTKQLEGSLSKHRARVQGSIHYMSSKAGRCRIPSPFLLHTHHHHHQADVGNPHCLPLEHWERAIILHPLQSRSPDPSAVRGSAFQSQRTNPDPAQSEINPMQPSGPSVRRMVPDPARDSRSQYLQMRSDPAQIPIHTDAP